MAQLTFNPDSAGAWSVTLKEGDNTIGRAEDNDVRISEGGVSGHHCRVSLSGGAVTVTDLDSTNGTHLNGARVSQSAWAPGQIFYLGDIPVRLDGAGAPAAPSVRRVSVAVAPPPPPPAASGSPSSPPPPPPPPPPASGGPARLRIAAVGGGHGSGGTATATATASAVAVAEPELEAAASGPAVMLAPPGTRCRSHAGSLATWHCPKCSKYFCDLCVSTRATSHGPSHMCRGCGVECAQVQMELVADEGGERGFFSRIGGAFVYPFRSTGLLILIAATLVFAALSAMGGIFSILLTMAATGYLFLFLQNIIHSTAAGDETMPSMPDFDGLFGAFFTLLGTVIISFILPVGLGIAKLFDVEIPTNLLIGSVFISLLYFPMAFLAVAMLDSVAAANPLVVIPSILRVPAQYLVTVILLCGVYGVRLLGDLASSAAGDLTYTTTDMSVLFATLAGRALWSFLSIYLLTVSMRILGLLYVTQRDKLNWI